MDKSDSRRAFALLALYGNRYPLTAASLATGTLVRLLPENSIIHNHKYFALCIEVTPSRRRIVVPVRSCRGFCSTLMHKTHNRLRTAQRRRPRVGRRIDRGLDQPELYRTGIAG